MNTFYKLLKLTAMRVFIILITLVCDPFAKAQNPSPNKSNIQDMIRRDGRRLVKGKNTEIELNGACFGNKVWSNVELPYADHSEQDFKKVAEMGMNVVRFYLNYKTFEDDKKPFEYKGSGWKWLDTNIAWAKKYHIYLILNMHVPQGGFQSGGKGLALWDVAENQHRLKALWYNIAKRYADEPIIAGYDLLNEPVVSKAITQWETLAQGIADTIRSTDENHLLIVESMDAFINASGARDYTEVNSDKNLFLIKDDNTMYTFHFYQPFRYTHMFAGWTHMKMADGGKWPDENAKEKDGYVRNKALLQHLLDQYLAFGKKYNVPMYLGEYGVIRDCFEKGRGGINWVSDMLDIIKKEKINSTYHVYTADSFGIFYPDPASKQIKANQELIELFKNKLN